MNKQQIERFQSYSIDWNGEPLDTDGDIGPKTQWAMDLRSCGWTRENVVKTALDYVGVAEDPIGSNRSTQIDEFAKPSGLEGIKWCCAFVSYIMRKCEVPWPVYYTSVFTMASQLKDRITLLNPLPGDLFFFTRTDGSGHTGIVTGVSDKEIMTVEGNLKNAVRPGRRDRSKVKFISIKSVVKVPEVSTTVADVDGKPTG